MMNSKRRMGNRRVSQASGGQKGQAIVWLLGTMAAAAAVMLGVYSVGQVTVAKQKTVNAADAAALSGATVQARVLNLVAYNNRSIMANEVFLAQSLSLEAWLGYAQTTGRNFGIVANFIPYVGTAIGRVLQQASQIAGQARNGMSRFVDFLIPVMEGLKTGFSLAHQAVLLAGGALAENAASNVVQANRADFNGHGDAGLQIDNSPGVRTATIVANEVQWNNFTKRYTNNDRGDAKQVLLDSRDPFSVNRPGNFLFNITLPFVAKEEKRGGTQLVNYDRWESEDTLELGTWNAVKFKWEWGIPIGYGRANADRNGSSGNTWGSHPVYDAAWSDGASHSHRRWTGVPSLYDVRDQNQNNRDKLHIDFLVAVQRPQANTMTSQNLGMGTSFSSPTGSPEMNENLSANKLSALSKGVVFFERPKSGLANDATASPLWRPDGAKEYGSLYSPYWQARVTDLTQVEKAGLMALVGPAQNAALVRLTPGGQR
ncbi:MAG TPA: pilus assembly protein TadG-related protein [Ideonella sp.]|uniref:pilus assembly protein TadG-related protein n=1 Tax=Ideonella sp. TaxID=1929293 RepID=UPI002B73DE9A|nr:pilus assembly protein TadG-related protein [Ideonella sp.]HSI48223.1 pilus assembly protein TadG-related protein [Ideonella sp.]